MSTDTHDHDPIRDWILAGIDRSERGKWTIKLRTLVQGFGYTAQQRMRQSSLVAVETTLTDWGVVFSYPGGYTPDDRITLSRRAIVPAPPPVTAGPQKSTLREMTFVNAAPLPLLFHIGDTRDDERSRANAGDLLSAIWACRPVCLLIEANDEFFTFACGLFAALMRRRATMIRRGLLGDGAPVAPTMLSVEHLKQLLGQSSDPGYANTGPMTGAVYLFRENPDDVEDDELVATLRECFIPHTYRLTARFATTFERQDQQSRAVDAAEFPQVLQWMSAFAGSLQLTFPPAEQPIDLASLFAEACQLRDTLLARQCQQPVDAEFRAGFESSEHMALKSALLNGLRRQFPGETIAVEELMPPREDDYNAEETAERTRSDKPDLRVGNRIWGEIETLRGLALRGSDPIFALEAKLRQKLGGMKTSQAIWLMVPSDVALLAGDQLGALARNLNTALGSEKLQIGFVDLIDERPVFVRPIALPGMDLKFVGASWRRKQLPQPTTPLTWDDVAGYADMKARIAQDLLAPLRDGARYRAHGLAPANGLLLYGLPGCGKSYIGRVLAHEAGLTCRLVLPSDLSSMWLHESVTKTRELFDWAIKQAPCLLIIDELDAVAPQRREHNMHSDEKRQVNELLTQFDRIADKGVVVVATTNYVRGLDAAIQRSGRFDIKLPVFPPNEADRQAIFHYYLSPPQLEGFAGLDQIDTFQLASQATLFTPSDIRVVVQAAARRRIHAATNGSFTLTTEELLQAVQQHPRSIRHEMASVWLSEVSEELGARHPRLVWLGEEIERTFEAHT
jgi:AAA+ superfamily predicted ATPase